MEIRDSTVLVNKCHLVEDFNYKLDVAKSEERKKKFVRKGRSLINNPTKKPFEGGGFKASNPRNLLETH